MDHSSVLSAALNKAKSIELLNIFADKQHLAILDFILETSPYCNLEENPIRASNTPVKLSSHLGLSESTVSYHLNILETNGFITKRVINKKHFLFIEPKVEQSLKAIFSALDFKPKKLTLIKKFTIPQEKTNIEFLRHIGEFISIHGYKVSAPTRTPTGFTNYFYSKDGRPVFKLELQVGSLVIYSHSRIEDTGLFTLIDNFIKGPNY